MEGFRKGKKKDFITVYVLKNYFMESLYTRDCSKATISAAIIASYSVGVKKTNANTDMVSLFQQFSRKKQRQFCLYRTFHTHMGRETVIVV